MTFLKIHLILLLKCSNISFISFIVVIYHEKLKKLNEKKEILQFSSHYSCKLMKYLKSHFSNDRKELEVFHKHI